MPGNEVDQYMDSAFMRRVKKALCVLVCPVTGRDFFIIAHIVARVSERRIVPRIHPNRSAAKLLNIIEAFRHSRNIADSVCTRILKGLRINLVNHRI